MSSTPLASATAAAETTATATGGPQSNTVSFVGNTPSTALFFLAMAVGVAIAFLFVLFTIRFFVRSTFGLHVYGIANRGITYSPRQVGETSSAAYTNREIYEHLEYLRVHHFLREEFLERRFFTAAGRRRRRRRRRRGRLSKMKKLPQEDVDRLFPKCRYSDWLTSGDWAETSAASSNSKDDKSDASSAALARVKSQIQSETTDDFHVHELADHNEASSQGPASESSSQELPARKVEAHYDSGSCSICLDTYEPDDVVRGLICGHVFHADCVDPWLTLRRACCPICKRDYYKETRANAADATFTIEESNEAENGEPGEDPGDEHGERSERRENGELAEREEPTDITDGVLRSAEAQTETQEETDTQAEGGPERPADAANNRMATEDLDYDFIRGDASIQALFSELIPLSERVRVISDEFADSNIEARARQRAEKRYGKFFKVMFWKLMGVTKKDLYHWAVIDLYRREHVGPDGNPINDAPSARPRAESASAASEQTRRDSVELSEMHRAGARAGARSQEDLELEAHARAAAEQRV